MKNWEDLTISNNFIFTKVMSDTEICREVLSRLLPFEIKNIKIVEYEKVIDATLTAKGVRLDIYADDGEKIYDIEMQATDNDDLAKRSRFYQSHIDMENLQKGEFYYKLKDSFVIFICTFDLFENGLPLYTFKNTCVENTKIALNDGTTKMFFNSTAYENVKDKKLCEFLKYINNVDNNNVNTADNFIKKLMGKVDDIKKNKKWRSEYMSLSATLDLAAKQGFDNGLKQGIEKGKNEREMEIAINSFDILDDEKISIITGLDIEEIKKLRDEQS